MRRPSDGSRSGRAPFCIVTLRGYGITSVGPRQAASGRLAGKDWTVVFDVFGIAPRDVAGRIAALVDHGEAFCCCATSATFGLVCITGRTAGLEVRLELARCSPLEHELHERLQQARAELRDTGNRAETSPIPAIQTDTDGQIVWHNRAAERLLRRGVDRVTLARLQPEPDGGRTRLVGPDGQALGWARATTTPLPGGGRITHLEDMTAQIRAETDLDSIMTTLTETFAHLPQGIGIFDGDSKLILFNPALAQIFALDPALLAQRPSLRHFLEALRQRRMIPEQRDFTEWRSRFIEASMATRDELHTEDWPLPSGQTLQVSVRRNPRGALAFIFDDVTSRVMLESRYRAEIETTQATLERLAEAVAVFGVSGQVTYANPAFAEMLGQDLMDGLPGPSIDAICESGLRLSLGADTWHGLRGYVLSTERDAAWHAVDQMRTGGKLLLRASALPDGSTLLTVEAGDAFALRDQRAGRIRA